jgi:uncharacterized membrane protein YczE
MKFRITWKQLWIILLASNLIGFGVALFLKSALGSDSITVFQDGLHQVLHLSYGSASRLYSLVIITLALFVARKQLGLGTIISSLIVGFLIDFYMSQLNALLIDPNLFTKGLLLLLGNLIYTAGLSLLIYFNIGMNSLDCLLFSIHHATKIEYHFLRIMADLLLAVTGAFLGGVWGIGTLISVLTTGLAVKTYIKLFSKWI